MFFFSLRTLYSSCYFLKAEMIPVFTRACSAPSRRAYRHASIWLESKSAHDGCGCRGGWTRSLRRGLFRTHFRRPRKGVVPSCLRHLYLFVPLERTNGQKENEQSRHVLNFVFVSWQPNVAPASSPIRRDTKGAAVWNRNWEHRAVANRCVTCYLVKGF